MLDGIEYQRALSKMECYFRNILIAHTNKILEAKIIYWTIRANIRWANPGDENTKFFHAIATQVFRHNYITFLKTSDNFFVHEHDHKSAILRA